MKKEIKNLKNELKELKFINNFNNKTYLTQIGKYVYEYSYTNSVENFLMKKMSEIFGGELTFQEDDKNEIPALMLDNLSYIEIIKKYQLLHWSTGALVNEVQK